MRRLLLALLWVPGGCFDATIPAEARLSCATDADCPTDNVCVVGRCAPVDALRSEAPVPGDVQISPALVGLDGVVQVSFLVAGDLAEAPVVDADVGRPVRFDAVDGDDARHRFRYVVDGTEASGPAALTATLVDALGRTTTTALGSFTLDLVPPGFSEARLTRPVVGVGAEIAVEAVLDDSATVEGHVALVDGTRVPLAIAATGLRVVGTVQIDERFPNGEPARVVLRARDAAGNDSGDVEVGDVVVDLAPPTLTLQPPPTTVRPRDLIRFVVTSDEGVVAPAVAVTVDTTPADSLLSDVDVGTALRWSWVVPDPGADADVRFEAGPFADVAGNPATLPAWTVRIDRTAPELVVEEALPAQVRAGDVVAARFSFTEAVTVSAVEFIRFDEVITVTPVGAGAGPWSIAVPAELARGEGRYDAIVTAVDGVGNETRARLGSVVVDARPPALLNASFTPPSARLGATVTLQLTFSEPVAVDDAGALPGLVSNTPLTFVGQSGTTFTYALVVSASTPSPVEVGALTMRDLAGNEAAAPGAPVARLVVDNRAPTLTEVAPLAARVQRRSGNTIVITGRVDDVGAAVTAALDARAVGCTVAADGTLRCELPVADDDVDGIRAVGVNAVDEAGNTSSVAVLVTLDGVAPKILSAAFGQETVRPGGTVQLSLLADETLAAVELDLSTGATTISPGSSTVGLPVRAPSTGALTLTSARLVDTLGNATTTTFSPPLTVTVDGAGPAVVGSALSTNPRLAAAARAGDTIVVEADIELPLLEAPSFRFGAAAMTITLDDGNGHFEATHIVTEDDIEGAIVVGVTAADALGNIAFARLDPPIVVDLTPPSLIPGTTRIAIQGPANAPVPAPVAVGLGAQATFSWVISERTVGAPTFRLSGSGTVAPAALSDAGTSFSARFTSAALPEGRQSLVVEHEDAVGNTGQLDLGVVDVDLTPPAPLGAAERAQLVHVRAPHGSVTSAAPFHRLESRTTLIGRTGQTLSVALDAADLIRLTSGVIGGAISLPLERDFDRVFVQVYDAAGNVATVAGVTPRTELIAGLNGRVIGQNASNPHRIEVRRQFAGLGDDLSAREQNGLQVALHDDTFLTAAAEGRWQDSGPRPPPSARVAIASTTHRDSVYMFGGCTADGPSDEAWVFDGRGWKALIGADGRTPPPRCGAALASDGDRLFLFGGEGDAGLLDDIWAWDEVNWKPVALDGRRPGPRRDMAFAFDPVTGEFVVYGGATARGVDGEHWRASAAGDTWRLIGDGPPATRAAVGMLDGILVVAGGVDERGRLREDALFIESGRISSLALPGPRVAACGARIGAELMVIGGRDELEDFSSVLLIGPNDVRPADVPNLPAPLVDGACGAFNGKPVIFGGADGATFTDTTRMLFEAWDVVGLGDLPTARSHAATAGIEELLLVVGGATGSGPSNEVWEFREAWKRVGTVPPVARAGLACVDASRCLVIGGEDDRGRRPTAIRWERGLDLGVEVAVERFTPRTNPAVAMTRDGVVVFGGVTAAGNSLETCTVNDLKREPLSFSCDILPGPTSSAGAVMVATPEGPTLWTAGALWRFDGDKWVEIEPGSDTPPPRQFPLLAFGGRRIWLHGGQVGTTLLDDLWSFDGATWRQHDPADPFDSGAPGPRAGQMGFFDERLGRLVAFSGEQQPTPVADTWDFLPGDAERAAIVVDVSLADAVDFRELSVEVFSPTPHVVEPRDIRGIAGGRGTTIPLFGNRDTQRIAILPETPGALLSVDAIDLRLIRP